MPSKKELSLSHNYITSLLHYDCNTGLLYWKEQVAQFIKPGDIAGTDSGQGYITLNIDYIKLNSHRVAWFKHHGSWPKDVLDHIDGDRSNNRIQNLRECSRLENSYNRKLNENSTSGHKGITYHPRSKSWMTRIGVNGKRIYLGSFKNIDDAIAARTTAETNWHGNFSRK